VREHKLLAFCTRFVSNVSWMDRKVALTILAFALLSSARAQTRAADFQIARINRDLITTPDYNYNGAEQPRSPRERWLRVEVQFSSTPDFTDELTLKYYVLMNGKVLTGEVTHVNVLAGREHYSVIYLPPHAMAYAMQNRPASTASVENVAVQTLQKGEVKDELSLNRARPGWFTSLPALSGLLLNKNETPFAPLFWDRYEQIKSTGH
jgi:hypothetical protein